MKFRLTLLILLAGLLASGCATHQKAPGATFDRIGSEMQSAVNAKTKGADAALSQAMLPPLQLDLPDSAKSVEPKFDLAVSKAPAAQVYMALVSGTRYSMLVAPEVSGTVTVNLKNVTVREALETLRELYGYEFKIQGTRIFIQPNTLQTRLFQINYLAGKRQGQSDIRVSSGSLMMQSDSSGSTNNSSPSNSGNSSSGGAVVVQPSAQISTSQDSDFWNDLAKALNSIVGSADGRAVIVNGGSGVVLVKAFPTDIRNVENYLKMTQLVVERQVMLEAKILEVSLSEEFQAGVNWASFGSHGKHTRFGAGAVNPGTTLTTSGTLNSDGLSVLPGKLGAAAASSIGQGLFGLAVQTPSFAALLNFLETQGNVQVLSSPRIATINNQKAVLKVGTDDYYVTGVTSSSSTNNSNGSTTPTAPTINLQPFFSGISLDVTPQIDGENNVVLHVHPSISTVTEKQKIVNLGSQIGTYTLPLASSTVNETDSIVRVQDGNIVAIGGLMKQKQSSDANGLPGTTASSGLGLLFGARNSVMEKSELVIQIKPTIIRNDSSWKDDLVETQDRVQQLDPRLARPQGNPQ